MNRYTTSICLLFFCIAFGNLSAQNFCSNLPKIHNDIAFEKSFESIIGKQTSQTSRPYDDGQLVVTQYESTINLYSSNPGVITHSDYPGIIDFWKYQVTTSIIYDLDGQLQSAQYLSETIKKCLEGEEGWTFKESKRTYSSDEKVQTWTATRPLDTHFGFKVKNIVVYVYEEMNDSFQPTGRYGVRIEIG